MRYSESVFSGNKSEILFEEMQRLFCSRVHHKPKKYVAYVRRPGTFFVELLQNMLELVLISLL